MNNHANKFFLGNILGLDKPFVSTAEPVTMHFLVYEDGDTFIFARTVLGGHTDLMKSNSLSRVFCTGGGELTFYFKDNEPCRVVISGASKDFGEIPNVFVVAEILQSHYGRDVIIEADKSLQKDNTKRNFNLKFWEWGWFK